MRFATSLASFLLSIAAVGSFALPANAMERLDFDICTKVPDFCTSTNTSEGGGGETGGDYGGDSVGDDSSHDDPNAPRVPDPSGQPTCQDLRQQLATAQAQLATAQAQLVTLQTNRANAIATATANVNAANAAYNAQLAKVQQLATQLAPYKEPPEINPHTGRPYGPAHPSTYDTTTQPARALFNAYQQALRDLAVASANLSGAQAGLASAQGAAPSTSIATLTTQISNLQRQIAALQKRPCRSARSKAGLQNFRAHGGKKSAG